MIWGFSFSLPFSFFFTSLHSCCYIPLLLFLLPAFTVSLSAVSVLYLAVFFVLLRDDRLTGGSRPGRGTLMAAVLPCV